MATRLPRRPQSRRTFSLAVKQDDSDHPVTNWLHEDAKVGDEVEVALGGDFIYEPDEAESVVLIAGGIGLTPLMSIVRSANELAARTHLTLVYSASTPDELLFRDELESIAAGNSRIRLIFTVTQPAPDSWDGHRERIDADLLKTESVDLDALFFVCGPPAMIRAMIAMLRDLGVPRTQIRYEQWW